MTTTTPLALTSARPLDEWDIERLDLDAYLARIGYAGVPTPDIATLRDLHRAHAAAIAFENLDIVLGRGIAIDLDSVQDKLVRRPRGGYCYEHNLLFAAALERIGFSVTRLAARVQPDRAGPRTHMLLSVVAEGTPWLADVGFGASLLEPLRLEPGTTRQGAWSYRLDGAERDAWLLRSGEDDRLSVDYSFTGEPQRPIDYAVYNHYTATHPRSPFVGRPVVLRTESDVKYALRGRELTTTRPDAIAETGEIAVDDLIDVLAEVFGIGLEAGEQARLRRAAA